MNIKPESIIVPDKGVPFEGGFYGGKFRSHGGLKIMGIIWAPKAEGEFTGMWLYQYSDVERARSCFHSMDNTQAMASAGSDLAKNALNLRIGGYDDWCLPARDILELGYRVFKPTANPNYASFRDGDNPSSIPSGYPYTKQAPEQTVVEAFREGGTEAFDPVWYWSSTQSSSLNAWGHYFRYGLQGTLSKKFEARARAVRLIQLNP